MTAGKMCCSTTDTFAANAHACREPVANGAMSGQQAEDCWFKGPERAFRYAYHRHGLDKRQGKELKAVMRLCMLEQIISDMRAATPHGDRFFEADLAVIGTSRRRT